MTSPRAPIPELHEILSPYDEALRQLAFAVRKAVLEEAPTANELIYDGCNAVSTAFSLSEALQDAFCHVAVYTSHVNLGFNRGAELEDPQGHLQGKGSLIRHLKIRRIEDLGDPHIIPLIQAAITHAKRRLSGSQHPASSARSHIQSVAPTKRRPGERPN